MQTKEEMNPADAYKSTLSQLSSSSKPEINALTMLAEDYRDYAISIVGCIENQLKTTETKLPVMHLIDSICKNFPKSRYVELFTQNIVSNFCYVFQVSDEKVRKSLHKLRLTWDTMKIFPQRKLEAIDERVHKMDPNWPVLHKITQQRQSNNNQAQQQQHSIQNKSTNGFQSTAGGINSSGGGPRRPVSNNNNSNTNNNNNNRRKRMRTDQNIQNNDSNGETLPVMFQPPQTYMDLNIMQASHDIPQVLPTTFMDPSITMTPSDQIQPIPTATYIDPNLIIASANDPSQLRANPQIYCAPQFNANSQNQQPAIQQAQKQQQPVTPQTISINQPSEESQPAHITILESLYGGKQCSNCSLRFDDNNRYSTHLDWHFRQNQKTDTVFARRKWYYPLNLWVQFREINDDVQESDTVDSVSKDILLSVNDYEVPTAPASKEDEKNICSVCHETFEKFWAEEEEEWRLRNAKMYEDEKVYHPLCLMDMLQASAQSVQSCG